MGAYDFFRNFAIFMIILNLSAVLAGVFFPSLRVSEINTTGVIHNMYSQINSITPQQTGTIGDYITTFGLMKFFFVNTVAGNYYLWKMLGLDTPITLQPGAHVNSTWTVAKVLSIFVEFTYVIALIEFLRGRI